MSSAVPRVVIVGGGFGGIKTAQGLARANVAVTLIDKSNHHLFQPLLYQVATGDLSPANIASPIRALLRKQKNCSVLLGNVVDVDLENRQVQLDDKSTIPYDYLVLAAGATTTYFNRPEFADFAPGLKTLNEATEIRSRILMAFERAEKCADPVERARLLTFVVVGGGPTGVEICGALAELAKYTLKYDFRKINPEDAKILLIDASDRILSNFDEPLAKNAADSLQKLGVEIRNNTKVTAIDTERVILQSGETSEIVGTETVIWAAGVRAADLATKLAANHGLDADRAGKLKVNSALNISKTDRVFAIGDMAHFVSEANTPLPGVAPVAMQQGTFVAAEIIRRLKNEPSGKFSYRDRGSLAVIGRYRAVGQVGTRHLKGMLAWSIWIFIHLREIAMFENRVLVFFQWGWSFLTRGRTARLITQADLDEPRSKVLSK